PSSRPCVVPGTCSKARANPPNRSDGLRLSLFRRLVLVYLALVAAILFAVGVAAPGVLAKIWPVLAAIFLVGLSFTIVTLRTMSSRIQRLKDFAERAAAGDFAPLASDQANDEVADLGSALGRTVEQLGRTIRTLTDERNRSAAILGSMIEGVAVITGDERI